MGFSADGHRDPVGGVAHPVVELVAILALHRRRQRRPGGGAGRRLHDEVHVAGHGRTDRDRRLLGDRDPVHRRRDDLGLGFGGAQRARGHAVHVRRGRRGQGVAVVGDAVSTTVLPLITLPYWSRAVTVMSLWLEPVDAVIGLVAVTLVCAAL